MSTFMGEALMVSENRSASGVAPGSKHWWVVQNWLAELGLSEAALTPLRQLITAGGLS